MAFTFGERSAGGSSNEPQWTVRRATFPGEFVRDKQPSRHGEMRGGSLDEPLAPSREKLISRAAVSAHEKAGRIRPAHSEENKNASPHQRKDDYFGAVEEVLLPKKVPRARLAVAVAERICSPTINSPLSARRSILPPPV